MSTTVQVREGSQMPSHDDAVRAERARIRREIHDVLGHHLTVIAFTSAATERIDRLPEPARAAIGQIRASVRAALKDLRLVLDDLDDPGTEPGHDSPDPGGTSPAEVASLDELAALVQRVASAGLSVRLEVDGAMRETDGRIPRTAVRIVQEALTNSLRHGAATAGRIALAVDGPDLTVEVTDNGRPAGPPPDSKRAHRGLAGMRARMAGVRGDVLAGPLPTGGFQVRARFPWTPPAAEARA